MAVQSHERSVEIFRIRTEDEVRKKQARRRKRVKEKEDKAKTKGKSKVFEPEESTNEPIELADLFTPYLIVRASGKIRSFAFGDEETTSRNGSQVMLQLLFCS
jgi:U3 small nucleolar RNA-associated protein 12